MKILAFVDNHGDKKSIKHIIESSSTKNVDLLVCAGDLSNFGENLAEIIMMLNRTGKMVLIIHGNHEDPSELKKICDTHKNFVYLHKKLFRIQDYVFVGYGGGGFIINDFEFESFSNKLINRIHNQGKVVLVTHAPIYRTKTDYLSGLGHRGNKSFRKFIEKIRPLLVVCGHFHENSGVSDRIGNTLVINPGKNGTIIEI